MGFSIRLGVNVSWSLWHQMLYYPKRQLMAVALVKCIQMQQPVHKFGVVCLMLNVLLCCGHVNHRGS